MNLNFNFGFFSCNISFFLSEFISNILSESQTSTDYSLVKDIRVLFIYQWVMFVYTIDLKHDIDTMDKESMLCSNEDNKNNGVIAALGSFKH